MRLLTIKSITLFVFALALFSGGCAKVPHKPGFDSVRQDVSHRIGFDLYWHSGLEADDQVAADIDGLLEQPLTEESVVQIALLNNRRVQEFFQELGISKADLIYAGLLRNPVFDASLLFPLDGGTTEINLGITHQFLDIFLIPLRKKVAGSRFEEVRLQVSSKVMDLAYAARIAFLRTQANARKVELLQEKLLAAELAYDLAARLRQAGNITELALHEHRDHYEMARIRLRHAETSLNVSREGLTRLMGIWRERTAWRINDQLPQAVAEKPDKQPDISELESKAIESSLDLEAARQKIITAAHLAGIEDAGFLIPEIRFGAKAEKNGEWALGPSVSLPLPLFNRGHARHHGTLNLRRQQESYTALAVEIRSIAREAGYEFESARDIVLHYQNVVLPLRERIVNETRLQHNAMEVGPMDLLRIKEHQLDALLEYTAAWKNYQIARARVEHLLSGRVPENSAWK